MTITKKEKRRIVTAYRRTSMAATAKLLGHSMKTVRRILVAEGEPIRRRGHPGISL